MGILVTGAAGFIGAAVSEALVARGDHVLGIDNLNNYYSPALKLARIDRVKQAAGETFVFAQIDFADRHALEAALAHQTVEAIVHLGAQPGVRYSLENPYAYVEANVVGTLNMLEMAWARAVPHMVYASSSSVYGGNQKVPFAVEDRVDQPWSLYAATKRTNELFAQTYAHLYRLPLTGLRFFTVYGPWGRPDMMPWIFTSKILAGEPIKVFNHGDMRRDFTYIDDVVSGVLACLDRPPNDNGRIKPGGSTAPHAIYNIGNNHPEPLLKVIEVIEHACDRKAVLDLQPMQPGDVPQTFADIDAIARDTGYTPTTSVEIGFPAFVAWYKKYHGF